MTPMKRRNLQIIRISVISLILLLFVVYYISSSFLWKDSKTENDISPFHSHNHGPPELWQLLKQPKSNVFFGEKLIHLDLKGAPPSVSYFKEFFSYIKNLGATGVLIEYEDMFYYKDELEDIRALNAYEPSDIKEILEVAELNNLSVVPLIQTFGHVEFVLKLDKYKDMREVNEYPQALCPSHERVLFIIKKMIDQILEAHPKAKFIHIGCDEVMYLGQCEKCKSIMRDKFWTSSELFLNHVTSVATYINETYPGVRPIIWGDMIGKFNEGILKKSQISHLVDLMVWKYVPNVSDYITEDLLAMYARVFQTIWIASAFKGATGVNQITTDVSYHLANHIAWLKVVDKWKNQINFKGIAITGWQRYDHFAELCELLPVAIPSLISCLHFLNNPEPGINETKIIKILQCEFPDGLSVFRLKYFTKVLKCHFPGFPVFQYINRFYELSSEIKSHFSVVSGGWFSVYHVLHKFSNPTYLKYIFDKWPLDEHRLELEKLELDLKKALSEIYDDYTVEEWITSYVVPVRVRVESIYRAKEMLLGQRVWPNRPFSNNTHDLERTAKEICNSQNSVGCALLLI